MTFSFRVRSLGHSVQVVGLRFFIRIPFLYLTGSYKTSKVALLWAVAPCGLIEVCRSFRGASCHRQQGEIFNLFK